MAFKEVYGSSSKAGALYTNTAGVRCDTGWPIPWPKDYRQASSSKLLKETWLSLENRQRLTCQTYKDLVSDGDAGYIMDLPDVGVMENPVLRRKWFQHFNLDRERMICHSLEKCVAYINGKPICVPCPNSYVFVCFCAFNAIHIWRKIEEARHNGRKRTDEGGEKREERA